MDTEGVGAAWKGHTAAWRRTSTGLPSRGGLLRGQRLVVPPECLPRGLGPGRKDSRTKHLETPGSVACWAGRNHERREVGTFP